MPDRRSPVTARRARSGCAYPAARRRSVEAYVRDCAQRLGLASWKVQVDWTRQCEAGAWANNELEYASMHCTLRFADELADQDADTFRHTVAHELAHCYLSGVSEMACDMFATGMKKETVAVAEAALTHQVEFAVDRIADVFVQLLELPDAQAVPR